MEAWLFSSLAMGLAAAGTALIAKALWPKRWRNRKPASCVTCMSVWGSMAVQVSMVISGQLSPEWAAAWIVPWGLNYLGSVAICVCLLGKTTLFLPPPLIFPGDEHGQDHNDAGELGGPQVRQTDGDKADTPQPR